MKIVHVSNHVLFANGNVHAAVDLACAQSAAGHEVHYVSQGGDFETLLKENGVTHHRGTQSVKGPLKLLRSTSDLTRIVWKLKPDIIHAHMMTGALTGKAASVLSGTPLVTTVHNAFDGHAILMGLGDRVIGVSQAVAKHMVSRGVDAERVVSVLNGTLNVARRKAEASDGITLEQPAIMTICGLHERKGVRHLLKAFDTVSKANPDVHLYILGEGPDEKAYQDIAQGLEHASRIHFLGMIRQTRPYLAAADIFVLTSLQDPCPLVIPEAREQGCAIVATNVDGIPEMLTIGDAGVLVPPSDPGSLADALLRLLSDPEELQKQRAASLKGIEHFDIYRVMSETEQVYKGIMRRRA
ncbi:glycosyltransferase family 4 protein [Asticcacaulis sp. DXS10W]|uniref:Glycosyltransferase family 4 protein n=1 Tax=Asticcacaulis currens TaxID=2984210 RepID=A0ABT5I9A0_9CAUL|nr:glycosyltransferase family 4 protein [Asticcacaulis currens]MDC7692763.1 glycosyltransferase family 4 protein [Asticcacaulis currens]